MSLLEGDIELLQDWGWRVKCPACGARLDWIRWVESPVEAYVCGSRYTPEGVKEPCA